MAGEFLAIAGAVEAAFGIASGIYRYVGEARGAKDDLLALAAQIQLTFGSCKDLQKCLEDHEGKIRQWDDEDKALLAKKCVYQCENLLKRLTDLFLKRNSKVDPSTIADDFDPSFWTKLSWSFFKPELRDLYLQLSLVKVDIQHVLSTCNPASRFNPFAKLEGTDLTQEYQRQRQTILRQLLLDKRRPARRSPFSSTLQGSNDSSSANEVRQEGREDEDEDGENPTSSTHDEEEQGEEGSDPEIVRGRILRKKRVKEVVTKYDDDDEEEKEEEEGEQEIIEDDYIDKASKELEMLTRQKLRIEQADAERLERNMKKREDEVKRQYQQAKVSEAREHFRRIGETRSRIAKVLQDKKIEGANREPLLESLVAKSLPELEMDEYLRAALPPDLLKQQAKNEDSTDLLAKEETSLKKTIIKPRSWFSRGKRKDPSRVSPDVRSTVVRMKVGNFYGALLTCVELTAHVAWRRVVQVAEFNLGDQEARDLLRGHKRSHSLLDAIHQLPRAFQNTIPVMQQELNDLCESTMWHLALAYLCKPDRSKFQNLGRQPAPPLPPTVFLLWERTYRSAETDEEVPLRMSDLRIPSLMRSSQGKDDGPDVKRSNTQARTSVSSSTESETKSPNPASQPDKRKPNPNSDAEPVAGLANDDDLGGESSAMILFRKTPEVIDARKDQSVASVPQSRMSTAAKENQERINEVKQRLKRARSKPDKGILRIAPASIEPANLSHTGTKSVVRRGRSSRRASEVDARSPSLQPDIDSTGRTEDARPAEGTGEDTGSTGMMIPHIPTSDPVMTTGRARSRTRSDASLASFKTASSALHHDDERQERSVGR